MKSEYNYHYDLPLQQNTRPKLPQPKIEPISVEDTPETSEPEMLIEWVNTVEYPNCLVASSMADFKDGVIFCELVNEFVLQNSKPEFLRKINCNNPKKEQIIQNFEIALAEIRQNHQIIKPPFIFKLQPSTLAECEKDQIALLDFLHEVASMSNALDANHGNYQTDSTNYTRNDSRFDTLKHREFSPPQRSPKCQYSPRDLFDAQTSSHKTLNNWQKPPINPNKDRSISLIHGSGNKYSSPRQTTNPMYFPPLSSIESKNTEDISFSNYKSMSFHLDTETSQLPNLPNRNHQAGNKRVDTSHSILINEFNEVDVSKDADIWDTQINNSKKPDWNDTFQNNSLPNWLAKANFNAFQSAYNLDPSVYDDTLYNDVQVSFGHPSFATVTPDENPVALQPLINRPEPHPMEAPSQPTKTKKRSKSPLQEQLQRNYETDDYEEQEKNVQKKKLVIQHTRAERLRKNKVDNQIQAREHAIAEAANPRKKFNNSRKLTANDLATSLEQIEQQKPLKPMNHNPPNEAVDKKKLIDWLVKLTFLKEGIPEIEKKLPKLAKNGVFFADLIDKMEGKIGVLQGIVRHSQDPSQINSNFKKIASYFKDQENMNPRYLSDLEPISKGDDSYFWAFLNDIWQYWQALTSMSGLEQKAGQKLTTACDEDEGLCYEDILQVSADVNLKQGNCLDTSEKELTDEENESSFSVEANNNHYRTQTQFPPSKRASERAEGMEKEFSATAQFKTQSPEKPQQISNFQHKGSRQKQTELNSDKKLSVEENKRGREGPALQQKISPEEAAIIPQISELDKKLRAEVEEWLKKMGFRSLLARVDRDLIENPFRNGVLLSNLLVRVENEKPSLFYSKPETIEQCRANVYSAFEGFRKKKTNIPSMLLRQEESVIQGDTYIIWGILYYIMRASQLKTQSTRNTNSRSPERRTQGQQGDKQLPYSSYEIEKLEKTKINWLRRMRVIHDSYRNIESLETLKEQFSFVLCELIAVVTGLPLSSFYKKSNAFEQQVINLRNAFGILRNLKKMGQKFTSREQDILNGNKQAMLGLLEDLHRYFDGKEPRQGSNYFAEGPYYGEQSQLEMMSPERSNTITKSESIKTYNGIKSESIQKTRSLKEFAGSSDYKDNQFRLSSKLDAVSSLQNDIQQSKAESFKGKREGNYENISSPSKTKTNSSTKQTNTKASSSKKNESPQVTNNYSSKKNEMVNSHSKRFNSPGSGKKDNCPKAEDIKKWLCGLGLERIVCKVDFNRDKIPDFTDGIFFAMLYELLEGKEIQGIMHPPKTNASRLVNIRKTLQAFSRNPLFDQKLLHHVDDILIGKNIVILKYLHSIKSCYTHLF